MLTRRCMEIKKPARCGSPSKSRAKAVSKIIKKDIISSPQTKGELLMPIEEYITKNKNIHIKDVKSGKKLIQ